jgi:hypothetical protein
MSSSELSLTPVLLNLTGLNWGWREMQKGLTIEDKAGARGAGHSVGDSPSLIAFFLLSILLWFFSLYLFFKALLIYNSLKPCF